MTDTKQRGGARKGAGRPRKQDYRILSISPSLTTLEQLQRIHPEITTAVEMAAQFYEENKMFILNLRGDKDGITIPEAEEHDKIMEWLDIATDDLEETTRVTGWQSFSARITADQKAQFDALPISFAVATIYDPADDDGQPIMERYFSTAA
jgi:hypothetical protein